MSDLDFEGRGRPDDVLLSLEEARRDDSCEVKARVVDEEISLALVDLAGRTPYSPESAGIVEAVVGDGVARRTEILDRRWGR